MEDLGKAILVELPVLYLGWMQRGESGPETSIVDLWRRRVSTSQRPPLVRDAHPLTCIQQSLKSIPSKSFPEIGTPTRIAIHILFVTIPTL
jgi:hypothetical protein